MDEPRGLEEQSGSATTKTGRFEKAVVRESIAATLPELFAPKIINDRELSVEEIVGILSGELELEIARALTGRRRTLESNVPVPEKYAFPGWDDAFQDAVGQYSRTFREIMQGLIDNFLGRETELAWRLNDEVPIPDDAHPLKNPGLELTGPWHPLDMAIKQINADVASTMGPDDEDAAPADYIPFAVQATMNQTVGLFVSRRNERRLLANEVHEVTVSKKGQPRTYRIEKPRDRWPTSFHRVPGIHLRTPHVTFRGRPAPAIIVDYVIHALNDYGSLKEAGSGLYYYQPKIQHPSEALVVGKLVWKLEQLMGAQRPGSFIKFKALYEEGNLGRFLPVVMWTWRYWLIGTNVGRWDYTGSLIEVWKSERVLPDPQNGPLMGMTSPHMIAYQRYNALLNVMAGMNRGKLTNAAPIGGMAAVMLYPETDPYGRGRHNPITLRAMKMDKLRERLIGLIFVPDDDDGGGANPFPQQGQVTLRDILEGRAKGRLYDAYRQSWVASPDREYVAAGNAPLRASLEELQAMLDGPEEFVMNEKPVVPKVTSGLTQDERKLLSTLRLLNQDGQITPWVIPKDAIDTPEKFLSSTSLWGGKELWASLYDIPEGDITIENIQHAFYMAANYGFQVLNGNLAAAIDDYRLIPNRVVRFMNDLATYRIFVGWLWSVSRLQARITRDGWLKKPGLTQDGVVPSFDTVEVKAGTRFTRELLEQLPKLHDEWTGAFFEDFDRQAAIRIIVSSVIASRLNGTDHPPRDKKAEGDEDHERLVERLVQQLASLVEGARISPKEVADKIGSILLGVEEEPATLADEADAKLLIDALSQVRQVLSEAYGRGPSYRPTLSYEMAAAQIATMLGIKPSNALTEIRAAAPRFDRSKASVIMDVLKRQLLCPFYIQHSPRVLFVIADKDDETRAHILDAIYYLDENGTPLFRGEAGEPSRAKLQEAVANGKLPGYALEAHDYVYDISSSS